VNSQSTEYLYKDRSRRRELNKVLSEAIKV